jgi:hypothetical protein
MAVIQKQPDRKQLHLLLPIGAGPRPDAAQPSREKAKIAESKKRLMSDLERSGLVKR